MNKEIITILTPTGARPEGFALCEKYIKAQTVFSKYELDWIVVDDCSPPTKCTMGQRYFRSTKEWRPGINTQRLCMNTALENVRKDTKYLFVVEDDDYYAPRYFEEYIYLLQHYDIVGECNNKYFNIASRKYREWGNLHHASLCSTAMRDSCIHILDEAVNSGELFFDLSLWRKCKEHKVNWVLMHGLNLGIGMKGLPGRTGIGGGHHPDSEPGFISDPGFEKLKEWVGPVATQEYISIAMRKK